VEARADDARSHDNLFHAVLGMLDIRTQACRGNPDFFRGCRRE
jgi:glucan phosphoethanolaminetransferase (alkaline phosphatase superfamily)